MEDILRTIIYLMVILALPINLTATYMLLRLSYSNPNTPALAERAVVAATLAIASMAGFVLSITRLAGIYVEPTIAVILNGLAAILVSVPEIYWLYMYKSGGFNE